MKEEKEIQKEEKGMIRQIVEVFRDKMKELKPLEATGAFIVLSVIFTFGFTGFVAAIATGVVKLIQVIATVIQTGV